ncbi:MAG: type II secretion system F family protein [Kiritimatiellia bacterium]
MNSVVFWLSVLAWALCAAGLAYYSLGYATQMTYVTLADGRQQVRSVPLVFRLLLPLAPNLDPLLCRPFFTKTIQAAAGQLVGAGYEGLFSGREFVALKLLVPAVATLLLALLFIPFASSALLPWIFGTLFAWMWPLQWLRSARNRRMKSIIRALPFVLDLLTLSVEAGMDFMGAVQRNCERRAMDPLNEELLRVMREIQIGTTRKVALKNLAERVRLQPIRTLCSALIQADELGVSIGTILRIQSEQSRQERFERAEKLAHEAPTKILFPLLLFIFPATIIILLGPVVANVFKEFL